MSAEKLEATVVSEPSAYIHSSKENELISRLIGEQCVSLCTTVAHLFINEGTSTTKWIRKHTGALCFIKNNVNQSYCCQIYCLVTQELLWQQQMTETTELTQTRPYLLTLKCQNDKFSLNFAFEEEARAFLNCVHDHKRQKDGKPRKLTKADIGHPTNFKHVTHVGWNAKNSFDLSGDDEGLIPFLKKAGVSESDLQDQSTRDFIHDFIQTHNVEDTLEKENEPVPAPAMKTSKPYDTNQNIYRSDESRHETLEETVADLQRRLDAMAVENLRTNQKLQMLEKNIATR